MMNHTLDENNTTSGFDSTPEAALAELMAQAAAIPSATQRPLTDEETDTLGEVGNICMGAVATTMYELLDRRVSITTPRVDVLPLNEAIKHFPAPLVVVEVEYIDGFRGNNLLLLEERDAALITDILMGGDGIADDPVELSDLHMSAINEIMNQLTGASATALSKLLNRKVVIAPPVSHRTILDETNTMSLDGDDDVIVITFSMDIENLLNSQIIQVMPFDVGKELADTLSAANKQSAEPSPMLSSEPETPAWAAPAAPAPPPVEPMPEPVDEPRSTPVSLNLIHDIPVQVSVELGRTKKEISEILDFDTGTVVVLDKAAGDPVEIYVNGKLVASGEVVVIDENYGVRITALYS